HHSAARAGRAQRESWPTTGSTWTERMFLLEMSFRGSLGDRGISGRRAAELLEIPQVAKAPIGMTSAHCFRHRFDGAAGSRRAARLRPLARSARGGKNGEFAEFLRGSNSATP